MEIKHLIKSKREAKGWTMKDLAKRVGVSEGTISRWESGDIANMRRDKIRELGQALNISPAVIAGWDELEETSDRRVIPILGRVAAGIPIEAIEDIVGEEEVPEKLGDIRDLFGLKIKGDSMSPVILDGDIVIVRKQEEAESGDIVIATLNGDDAICKKLLIYASTVILRSLNSAYDDIDVTARSDFRIWGKVIEMRRSF